MNGRHVELDATPSVAQVVDELEGRDLFLRRPHARPTRDGKHVRTWHPSRPAPSTWLGAGITELAARSSSQAGLATLRGAR